MLLCKNHHGIIDVKDSNGLPLYSVAQLKAMKLVHEDEFEASRSSAFVINSSSLIAKVIKNLSSHLGQPKPTRTSHAFEIDAKIVLTTLIGMLGLFKNTQPTTELSNRSTMSLSR